MHFQANVVAPGNGNNSQQPNTGSNQPGTISPQITLEIVAIFQETSFKNHPEASRDKEITIFTELF